MIETQDAPGQVTATDDALQVVFHRHYARPIEKVWAAITTPERLADWLADAEIEMRTGGKIRLSWNDGAHTMEGRVLVCEPPKSFAWTWTLDGRETVVRFDLKGFHLPTRLLQGGQLRGDLHHRTQAHQIDACQEGQQDFSPVRHASRLHPGNIL